MFKQWWLLIDHSDSQTFTSTLPHQHSLKLAALYPQGGEVTVDDLVDKGAVRPGRPVKVLGTGEITVALQVSANAFSASAKEKVAAAGGTTTEV